MRKLCFIFIIFFLLVTSTQAQVTITNVDKIILCTGNHFTVSYSVSPGYTAINIFYVELSDPVGSFGAPQTVGSKTGNASGSITCTIPLSTPQGTGYRVRIRTTDPMTISSTNTMDLLIQNQYPLPKIYSDTTTCQGGPFLLKILNPLTGTGTPNPVQYSWYNPNGSKIQDGTQVTVTTSPFLVSGKYVVLSTYFGCTHTDTTIYVTVKPRPAAPILNMDDTICAGDTLHIKAQSSTPGVTYEWTGPNGFKSFSKDTLVFAAPMNAQGYYKVLVTSVPDGCRSLPDSQFVRVELSPPVNATNNGPLCEGATLLITSNDNTDSMKYDWTGPGGFTMTGNDTNIVNATTAMSGRYVLTATLYRCTVKDTTDVQVNSYPEQPKAGSNTPVCQGDQLRLTASGTPAGKYSWKGPFMNFDTTVQNPVIDSVPDGVTGFYVVTLDLNGCKRKDSTYVVIKPTPVAPIIASNSPVIKGDTLKIDVTNYSFGITYNWTGPGNFNSTNQNITIPDVNKDAEGIYTVTATYNVCSSKTSVNIQVLVPYDTGVFILYPNPNNGNFTIRGYTLTDQDIGISVYNSIGQNIYREETTTVNKLLDKKISLPYTAADVYLLKLKLQGKEHVFRFTGRED